MGAAIFFCRVEGFSCFHYKLFLPFILASLFVFPYFWMLWSLYMAGGDMNLIPGWKIFSNNVQQRKKAQDGGFDLGKMRRNPETGAVGDATDFVANVLLSILAVTIRKKKIFGYQLGGLLSMVVCLAAQAIFRCYPRYISSEVNGAAMLVRGANSAVFGWTMFDPALGH